MKPGAYGLWTRYAGQGKTVRQALVRLCSTLGVHQTGGSMRLRCHDSQVTWTYANPSCFRAVERAQAEHVVPVMIGFLRPFLGPNWLPNWIGVPFPDDGSGVKRSELFACSWRYEQEGVSLSFSAELLDETREADAEQLVCTRAEVDAARMRRDARSPDYVAKQIIALRLMEGKVDVEGAARLAGQSLRTFQRSLEREGVSYSKLLILVRRERAEALLRENALSGTEIAFRLGFADPANFTRAFRSWAGVSPSRFRELDGESR